MAQKELTPAQMLSCMISLCATRFDGVLDKGGRPYILHCMKVMHYLKSDDDELNAMAVGHDLVEDGKATWIELFNLGFSKRVIRGLESVTKLPGEAEPEQLWKILLSPDGCRVKLCDLRHNFDIRRLKGLRPKDFDRMVKYQKWYGIIEANIKAPFGVEVHDLFKAAYPTFNPPSPLYKAET